MAEIGCVKGYRNNGNVVLYDVLEDEEVVVTSSMLDTLIQSDNIIIYGCICGKVSKLTPDLIGAVKRIVKPVTPRQLGVVRESLNCDYVLERHIEPDYTELVVSTGGDISCLRIYDDGSVLAHKYSFMQGEFLAPINDASLHGRLRGKYLPWTKVLNCLSRTEKVIS